MVSPRLATGAVVRVDSKLVELQDPYLTADQRQLIDAVLATPV